MGVERALIVLEALGKGAIEERPDVYIVQATPAAKKECYRLAATLRNAGISTMIDYEGRSMKSQLKTADKEGAKFAVLIGDDELAKGVVTLRTLANSEQTQVPADQIIETLRGKA